MAKLGNLMLTVSASCKHVLSYDRHFVYYSHQVWHSRTMFLPVVSFSIHHSLDQFDEFKSDFIFIVLSIGTHKRWLQIILKKVLVFHIELRYFPTFCSPVHPVTNVGPLVLVLAVSLIKEAFEDRVSYRHKSSDFAWSKFLPADEIERTACFDVTCLWC